MRDIIIIIACKTIVKITINPIKIQNDEKRNLINIIKTLPF